jgi:hypothetical protein
MSSFEQKYQMGTDDGCEIIWDINALLKDLQNKSYPVCNRRILDFDEINNSCGDIEYAMSTDLENPCIVVELTETIKKLIDGNHRLYKAKALGIESISCYFLPLEYHKKFILDYSDDIYKRVASFHENVMNDITGRCQ